MIVADTTVWVKFLKKKEDLFPQMVDLLENGEVLGIECIFGELLQGARTDREIKVIEDYWKNVPKTNEKGLWIEAGRYSGKNKLLSKGVRLIDALIIIAARKTSSMIWTLDNKFKRYWVKKKNIICLAGSTAYNVRISGFARFAQIRRTVICCG